MAKGFGMSSSTGILYQQMIQSQRAPQRHTQKWLTTTRKRGRKPKSLSPIQHPMTARDRVRWLQDRNQVLNDNNYQLKSFQGRVEDLGDTAEQRLNWMRNKIYDFWRDEPSSSGSAEDQAHRRPTRIGTKLDAKWWFWNTAFALFPAFLLFVYCQFIALPKLLDMSRLKRIEEQREKLGDAYVQEEDEEIKQMQPETRPFISRLASSTQELVTYLFTQEAPVQEPTTEKGLHTGLKALPKDNTSNQRGSLSAPSPIRSQEDIIAAQSIAELKSQLEALERKLEEKVSNKQGWQQAHETNISSTTTKFAERREERKNFARIQALVKAQQEEDAQNHPSVATCLYETSKYYYYSLSEMIKAQNTAKEATVEREESGAVPESSDRVATSKHNEHHCEGNTMGSTSKSGLASLELRQSMDQEQKRNRKETGYVLNNQTASEEASEQKWRWWLGWLPK